MNKFFLSLENHAKNNPDKIALLDGAKQNISYKELCAEIDKLVQILENKGLKSVAILADNSPSWIIFDLACLKAGIILTPIPHFFTDDQIVQLLDEACIQGVLNDGVKNISLQVSQKEEIKIADKKFFFDKIEPKKFLKISPKEVVKITFTSGTTGTPKGVCLSEKQIENVVFSLVKKLEEKKLSSNLSLLPLSILLENIAGVYVSLVIGSIAVIPSLARVGIGGSSSIDVEKFSSIIAFFKPSSCILVPELAKLLIGLVAAQKIPSTDFKFIAVGGAKISADLLKNAAAFGLPLYQGYGLSEVASVVSLNLSEENKIGSVGKILPHIEVKIAADGEILLKGNLALQYSDGSLLKQDSDGWYRSGDVGYFDEDGFLFISGRKKNIFITSMGRNVNPEWVESELLKNSIILQAAVFGEGRSFNIAIITTSQTNLELLQKAVDSANKNLPDYAQVKKIILARQPFSVENKMLTGTGRIKREEIFKNYQNELSTIYNS